MPIFQDIALPWRGKDYTIAGNSVTRAIAAMEEVLTLTELYHFKQRGSPPFAKLARAYALLLKFAGAEADENEVFARMLSDAEAQQSATAIVDYLFGRLMADATKASAADAPRGNGSAGAARSSRNSTRRSSAAAS
jgi:hypothetical protein